MNNLGMNKDYLMQRFELHFSGAPLTGRESSLLEALFEVIAENNAQMKGELEGEFSHVRRR